jgi:hypothetical protein
MPSKFQTFTPTDQRLEIGDAVKLICDRIALGEPTTSIVFPPRFGKSDVIRAGAAELRALYGGTSVVLAHWRFLASQLLHAGKVKEMMRRLKMPGFVAGKLEPGKFWGRFFEQQPARDLWALTTAAACQPNNLQALLDAATLLQERGEQLRVFIDESHSIASVGAAWGEVAALLREAGAHVILLTGTPLRNDNIAPFGFVVEETGRKPVEYWIPGIDDDDNPIFRIYAAERVGYRLKADLEVTRKAAWDRGILTPIQARWFGFPVGDEPIEKINDDSIARKALAVAVRDLDTLSHAVEILVDDVLIRRHGAPTSAAIVYVGNDSSDETKDATHTRQVAGLIERIWQGKTGTPPRIVVAMLKDSDAAEAARRIEAFVGDKDHSGIGDVLIVKQMGGVGLDADRIKTCLDLSVVRSVGSCIQRWLRVCTIWEGRDGKRLASNATLILPADCITTAIHHHVVTQQGGDFKATENAELIDEKPRDDDVQPPDELSIGDPYDAGVTNLNLESIDATVDGLVSALLRQQPKLALIHDRLELAQCLASGQYTVLAESDGGADQSPDGEYTSAYVNPDNEIDGLKAQINDLAKKLTDREWNYGTHKEAWVACLRGHFNDARRFSGASVGIQLLQDVALLQRQITYFQTRLAGG